MRHPRHREGKKLVGGCTELAKMGLYLISLHLRGLCSLYTWKYVVWEPGKVLLFQMLTYQIVLGGRNLRTVAKRLHVALGLG